MIYTIKLVCEEVDGFLREIKIDSEATFLDLNNAILKSCGYRDEMTSFFLTDDSWERQEQITREDMGCGSYDDDAYVMEKTRLNELIDDEGQRMEFIFDPFNERSFYLKVSAITTGEDLDEPEITRQKGDAPQQILDIDTEDLIKTLNTANATETEEDVYDPYGIGGETHNDDEFDVNAYEISDNI